MFYQTSHSVVFHCFRFQSKGVSLSMTLLLWVGPRPSFPVPRPQSIKRQTKESIKLAQVHRILTRCSDFLQCWPHFLQHLQVEKRIRIISLIKIQCQPTRWHLARCKNFTLWHLKWLTTNFLYSCFRNLSKYLSNCFALPVFVSNRIDWDGSLKFSVCPNSDQPRCSLLSSLSNTERSIFRFEMKILLVGGRAARAAAEVRNNSFRLFLGSFGCYCPTKSCFGRVGKGVCLFVHC